MKNYILLFTVQLCAAFSIAILSVTLISVVHNNNGSVSVLMLTMTLPSIFFSRIIGDFFDKDKSRRFFSFAILFELFLLTAVLVGSLFRLNMFIYLFAFFTFYIQIFVDLLLQTTVTHIAKAKHYLKFNSILSLVENIGIIIGPILGGYFVYRNNLNIVIIIAFLLYILILISAFFLKPSKADIVEKSMPDELSAVKTSIKIPKLKTIFYSIALFSFAISIINVMQISFIIEQFNTNELGFGLTESAWGAGMAVGAFVVLLLYKKFSYKLIFGSSYIIIGLAVFVLLIGHNFYFALILFLLIGTGNCIISIVSTTMIQQTASADVIGKSLRIKSMFFNVSSLLAMTITGFLEWTVPPIWLFMAAGVIFLMGGILNLVRVQQS